MTTGDDIKKLSPRERAERFFERIHGRPRREYTDRQPVAFLYKEQRDEAYEWAKKHDEEKHIPEGEEMRYSGAIGGAYTWCFTATSIGVVAVLRCSCGEEINVTDYDNW